MPPALKPIARNFFFAAIGERALGHAMEFKEWVSARHYFLSNKNSYFDLVNLKTVPAIIHSDKSIAIHLHAYYIEAIKPIPKLLRKFPLPFTLLISTNKSSNIADLKILFSNIPNLENIEIKTCANRGRDIAPMINIFGERILEFQYFAHIHTKKSLGVNSIGNSWRNYLYTSLLSNKHNRIDKILSLLEKYSIVYPQKFHLVDFSHCTPGNNLSTMNSLFEILDLNIAPSKYIEFPVGSMFWAQTKVFSKLLSSNLSFEEENFQSDGTLAHAIERSLALIATASGQKAAIIQNDGRQLFYP